MPPLREFDSEAKRILEEAEAKKLVLRLFGGVSFMLRCPSSGRASLKRDYLDLDFMGYSKQSREISRLFKDLGYVPREMFNARMGYQRLIFNDLEHHRRVDIFLDVFEMCHKFNFKKRLEVDRYTLPLADMLATKLQIIQINEKDRKDLLSLFTDHDLGPTDGEAINSPYIARLCSDDWGIYKTFTVNLDNLLSSLSGREMAPDQEELLRSRIGRLRNEIELAPKSLSWKLRARVGDKVRWYELPEVDAEVVDSRVPKDNPAGVA